MPTGEGTALGQRIGAVFGGPVELALALGRNPQAVDLGALGVGGEHVDQGVLRRHHGVGHPEARVGARREDPQDPVLARVADDLEVEFDPFGAPDPVALHGLDTLGPVDVVEGVEQLLHVAGGAQEPLLELALDDQVARALAGAVGQHLLVGQHRLAPRAPVDGGQRAVGEPGLEEPQEDDLVPADVGRIVAPDLTAPVVDRPQPLDAGLQLGDAGLGEGSGVFAGANGGVLGGKPEGVEAEGREDGESQHGAMADEQVPEGVVADMALMGRPARVRVHAQHVLRGAGVVGVDLVEVAVGPALLPLELHFLHVVGARHCRILGNRPIDLRQSRQRTACHDPGKRPDDERGRRRLLAPRSPVLDPVDRRIPGARGRPQGGNCRRSHLLCRSKPGW